MSIAEERVATAPPAATWATQSAHSAGDHRAVWQDHSRGTVVVVVHERALRHAACSALRQAGHQVISASTSSRGLEMLGQLSQPPVCIVLDSAGSGSGSTAFLAKLPLFAAVGLAPVIMVACDPAPWEADARVTRTLRKPVDPHLLPLLIAALVPATPPLSPDALPRQAALREVSSAESLPLLHRIKAEQIGIQPAPPATSRALDLTGLPRTPLRDLVNTVAKDTVLATWLVRVANSPLHLRRRRVRSLAEAMVTLGLPDLRLYLLTSWIMPSLRQPLPLYGFPSGALLEHAVWTAVLARLIVCRLGLASAAADAYLAGLLHDAGKVPLNALWLEQHPPGRGRRYRRSGPTIASEQAAFGLDHARAGSALAQSWHLGPVLHSLIAQHHASVPGTATDPVLLALSLANCLVPPRRDRAAHTIATILHLDSQLDALLGEAEEIASELLTYVP